jgi:hypothetical protein
MNDFQCEHCKNILKSKSSLHHHIKTNKKCIQIRNQILNNVNLLVYIYECKNCNYKTNNKQHLNRHQEKCIVNIPNITLEKYNYEISLKNTYIDCITKQFNEKQINFETQLKEKDKMIESLQQTIAKIAEQPKIVTTTNNTNQTTKNTLHQDTYLVLNLNKDNIKKIVDDQYSLRHYYRGLDGVAEFCYDNIICDNEGNCRGNVSDASRGTLIYKNDKGDVVRDHGCASLMEVIYPPVFNKSTEYMRSEMEKHKNIITTKEGEERTNAKYMEEINKESFLAIKDMKEDNKIKKFRDPLIKNIITKKKRKVDIEKEKENEREKEKRIKEEKEREEKEQEERWYKLNEEEKMRILQEEEDENIPQDIIDRDNRIIDEIEKESKYLILQKVEGIVPLVRPTGSSKKVL